MEEQLEAAILGGADDAAVEHIILDNILINRGPQEPREDIFNLDNFSEDECILNFRFSKEDIPRIQNALGIPETVVSGEGHRMNGLKATCLLLERFAYPSRLFNLIETFDRSPQTLSQILQKTVATVVERREHLLNNLNNLQWLNRQRMQIYADAIFAKGGVMNNCWAFIDGTARPICRPTVNQGLYYSGHKRHHCIKFQSLVCPDGIIVSLKGAYPGSRHDAGIFQESRIYDELEEKAVFGNDNFVIYGDQGYPLMDLIITPFRRDANMQPQQQEFNTVMSTLRIAVEWGFGKVVQLWAGVDYKKKQQILMQDCDANYKVAVLLTNAHTCLYGHNTSSYFNVAPPQLEEYFQI